MCALRLEQSEEYLQSGGVIMNAVTKKAHLRSEIAALVEQYAALEYQSRQFMAGQTAIPPSGKVIGADEIKNMVDAALDGWLTTGRFNQAFEKKMAEFMGVKHLLTVNSGSSANLLAVAALTSGKLGARALRRGDEVITVAAGFPTTVNPLLHYGLVPVFVDIELPGYNIDAGQIEAAISPSTKAIVLAHTLGNTFDVGAVVDVARKYNLWLIEDCCDALGSTYTPAVDLVDAQGKTIAAGITRHVGTFGDIATLSFYPAHQITMGEGGAVFTENSLLKRILESFRDWGRDCFCEPGKDNTCRKRFDYQLGELPQGYDHKYTYSHAGFNFKITDMQASVGLAQLQRLPGFIGDRQRNFQVLRQGLAGLSEFLILPEATEHANPSWFGFAMTLKQPRRREFIAFLQQKKIDSRLLFAGNLIRQPYFAGREFRQVGELPVTETVMNQSLWIACYPGLNSDMLDYMIESIKEFFTGRP